MDHRRGRLIFGAAVGLAVMLLSYRWVSDPAPRIERERQEQVVIEARRLLADMLSINDLELVDPLAPNRKVGKTYVFPNASGWEISGYYRRDENDRWHPYLMWLNQSLTLEAIKVRDSEAALAEKAANDTRLTAMP